MKSKKPLIFAIIIGVALIGFYMGNNGENDDVKITTQIKNTPQKREFLTKNIETKWGPSPFAIGDPVAEYSNDKFPKIAQPKTSWEDRTLIINGVATTYKFGEGNPSNVTLSGKDLEDFWKNNGNGYITPESEKSMKTFLENPDLPYFLERCYKQIDWYSDQREFYQEWEKFPTNLDMNDIMYVDENTGRKEFKTNTMLSLNQTFSNLDQLELDEKDRGWAKCLSNNEYIQKFLPLREQFNQVAKNYTNQWGY